MRLFFFDINSGSFIFRAEQIVEASEHLEPGVRVPEVVPACCTRKALQKFHYSFDDDLRRAYASFHSTFNSVEAYEAVLVMDGRERCCDSTYSDYDAPPWCVTRTTEDALGPLCSIGASNTPCVQKVKQECVDYQTRFPNRFG